MKWTVIGVSAALLVACNQKAAQNQSVANNTQEPVEANASVPLPEANGAVPDDRTPHSEPRGPIDPRSAAAAGQVVQHYGALIERGHWLKAERLWGDVDAARDEAVSLKRNYAEYHVEIGKPGKPEGAAGSVYVNIPGAYYGKFKDGKPFRHSINFVLRRVNDVPGSTDAQRRWHIERIESTEAF